MADVLVISAHPDDETLFTGGTMAMYAGQGHAVHILETTRGEGGEVGEPPLATMENLSVVREQEVRNAAKALGASDIFFLPFVDPHMEIGGTARRIDVTLDNFVKAIGAWVQKIRPDLVITHGSNGEYGHPQHIYTHQATLQALAEVAPETALISWCAWYEPSERKRFLNQEIRFLNQEKRILNQDDHAHIVRDITPWLDVKIAAALCHKTQHAMFLRNSGASTVAEMVGGTESFHIWKGPVGHFR